YPVPHEAVPQDAVPQDAVPQEAVPQDASACAVVPHDAASKVGVSPPFGSGTTNCSSAAFGFGGSVTESAAAPSTSPTPSAKPAAGPGWAALSISAPFTWSGVQSGWSAGANGTSERWPSTA